MIWNAPGYLWLLLLLPLIYLISHYASKYYAIKRRAFFSESLFLNLQKNRWEKSAGIREIFLYLTMFFLIIALAGPKIGTEIRELKREQLDIIVALDLSKSMLAEDVRPSRLEKAKFEINRLLGHLENDRVALIGFTGDALLHCPLTSDYYAFRMFLDIAAPDIMPSTTTNFAPMFREAISAFRSSDRGEENPARVLLLFSDGEDHFERYEKSFLELLEMGVYIFTVGIGTEEGGRIPVTDDDGGAFRDFHRDRQGNVVTTRLQPERLQTIARNSGGEYYQISRTAHTLDRLISRLGHLDRSTLATEEITQYQDRFYYPAALSLISFLLFLLLPGYKALTIKNK